MSTITKPEFKKAFLNTLLAEVPSIINENNDIIENLLDQFIVFNDGNQSFIKADVSTSGTVNANTGRFQNLITENFTVNGETQMNIDSSAISYDRENGTTVYNAITNIDSSVKDLYNLLELAHLYSSNNNTNNTNNSNENILGASTRAFNTAAPTYSVSNIQSSLSPVDANAYIGALTAKIDYTYHQNFYLSSYVYDPSIFKCKADYKDTLAKKQYKYYNTSLANKYIKVDNELPACLRFASVGDAFNIIFDNLYDRDFIIKIGKKFNGEEQCIIIKPEDTAITTVQLICVAVDDDKNCIFNIVGYTGKIELQ